MPVPGVDRDRRLVGESFRKFFGEVASLVKRREVLIVVLLFVAPTATFAMNNMVGDLGPDFRASPHLVGEIGGIGVTLGGIAGSYGFRLIAHTPPKCLRLKTRASFAGATSGRAFDEAPLRPVDRARDHHPVRCDLR